MIRVIRAKLHGLRVTGAHPRILTFTANNEVDRRLRYRIEGRAEGHYDFHIDEE